MSNALNVVYGGNHKFIMEVVDRRNRHEVDYYIDDGFTKIQLKKPFAGKGGGKITVVALSLQLAVAEQLNVKGPMFLDEVGKMLDSVAIVNFGYFLKQYSEKFGRQIILITHHEELSAIADVGYKIIKKDGISKVHKVGDRN